MTQCCAPGCKNQGRHIFPRDPNRRKAWEKALRIKNFKATKYSVLCYDHFVPDDYFGQSKYNVYEPQAKLLKKTAVPSIFSFTKTKLESSSAKQRLERLENKGQKKLKLDVPTSLTIKSQLNSETSSFNAPIQIESCNEVEVNACEVQQNVERELTLAEDVFVCKGTQINMEQTFWTIQRFKTDDEAIQFYTGFETYKKFYFVYSILSPVVHKINYLGSKVTNVSKEDQFFLTLMKLRQDKCNFELSRFFNVSTAAVSNIFISWINFIYQHWLNIVTWPDNDLVQQYMPDHLKKFNNNGYGGVKLDGMHKSSQQSMISDMETVGGSDFRQNCDIIEVILSDHAYTQDIFAENNVTVNTTTFLEGHTESAGLIKDITLANKQVPIKNLISCTTKDYKILKSGLDHNYITIASKIFYICVICCYFRDCITINK